MGGPKIRPLHLSKTGPRYILIMFRLLTKKADPPAKIPSNGPDNGSSSGAANRPDKASRQPSLQTRLKVSPSRPRPQEEQRPPPPAKVPHSERDSFEAAPTAGKLFAEISK